MRLVEWIGWTIVVLVFSMTIIYPAKKIYLEKRDEKSKKRFQLLRKIHPYLGVLILILGGIHGYMAIGKVIWHTGTLLYGLILLMALISLLRFPPIKYKKWRYIHRFVGLLVWGSIFLHIFYRNIFF